MLVREHEPLVYTSTSNDWSAATIFLAGAVLALLGFLVYFFGIMHAIGLANNSPSQTVIQHEVTALPVPTNEVTVTRPIQPD